MKIGKLRAIWKWLVLAATACVLFVICGFFYAVPNHPANVVLFKVLYISSFNKKPFLTFYSPSRRDVASGYIPSDVDEFLCERAESAGSDEIEAIADFYSLQWGGRQGGCFYHVSDETAEKIANYLVSKIGDESKSDVEGEIAILEEIRTQKSLGKGGLSSLSDIRPMTPKEWSEWKYSIALPIARQRYVDWWNSPGTWTDKRKISPLAGTGINVSHCCG
jgi:hypothetical protein